MKIPCPHCGPRPLEEYLFGEIPEVPDSISSPAERNLHRAFFHANPEGPTIERWFHAFGCRRWITIRRDTRSDQILRAANP